MGEGIFLNLSHELCYFINVTPFTELNAHDTANEFMDTGLLKEGLTAKPAKNAQMTVPYSFSYDISCSSL